MLTSIFVVSTLLAMAMAVPLGDDVSKSSTLVRSNSYNHVDEPYLVGRRITDPCPKGLICGRDGFFCNPWAR